MAGRTDCSGIDLSRFSWRMAVKLVCSCKELESPFSPIFPSPLLTQPQLVSTLSTPSLIWPQLPTILLHFCVRYLLLLKDKMSRSDVWKLIRLHHSFLLTYNNNNNI